MIIERLSREHRNIEKLLAVLEREIEIFDRGDRPEVLDLKRPIREATEIGGAAMCRGGARDDCINLTRLRVHQARV